MPKPKTVTKNRISVAAGGPQITDIKELGSMTAPTTELITEQRKEKLLALIKPKDGKTSKRVKQETVEILLETAEGTPEQKLADLELLCRLGATFEPITHTTGPQTARKTSKIVGVGAKLIRDSLAESSIRKEWGAYKTGETKTSPWWIPEETVNKLNQTLKTAVGLKVLYHLLREKGVRISYHKILRLFANPEEMGEAGTRLLDLKGDDNLLVKTVYGTVRSYSDPTSAAGVARFLLDEKKRLDEGKDSKQVGEKLNMSWAQVNRLVKVGKLPGRVVVGMTTGRSRVRLTEDELTDAIKHRRPEEQALIKELQAINATGKQSDEKQKTQLIIQELLNRFSTHQRITQGVSKFGLSQLGLKISKEGEIVADKPEDTHRIIIGPNGQLPPTEELHPPIDLDHYDQEEDEAKLVEWLREMDVSRVQRKTIAVYPEKMVGDTRTAVAERLEKYGGDLDRISEDDKKYAMKYGVEFKKQSRGQVKSMCTRDFLIKQFGLIKWIGDNVSAEGLAKLGFKIEQLGPQSHVLTAIKSGEK